MLFKKDGFLVGLFFRMESLLRPRFDLSLRGFCNIIFEGLLVLLLAISFYLNYPIKSEKVIYIPKGSTKSIITYLQAKNYDIASLDIYFLRLAGLPQSGFIDIGSTFISKGDFLYKLANSKAATKQITLIPGESAYFFLRQIARVFNKDISLLEQSYERLSPYADGVILANTYSLPIGLSEEQIISFLITNSLNEHKKLAIRLTGSYNKSEWFKIISKASIIQKEAANVKEMPIVSSVIDNRIKINMPLQMDGTLNYGKYAHLRVTPKRIKEDLSDFNTYKYMGIPSSSSGSVSKDAIKAALNPATTNYLYFMKSKDGTHDFSATYKAHLRHVEVKKEFNKSK